jgi:class 3 adenylate cyclase
VGRGEERKLVTILFADVTGSTILGEQLDPEALRDVMDRYFVAMREELERHGGTVEKFIGDAVMALFGAPLAHEDDAERAVRAGYAVLQAVRRLPADATAGALRVRIGIATGEAVVDVHARPQEGDATAHGDVVNTASRLQTGAPVDGILVDERTYRATRFQIDFRQEPLLLAKGKAQPVPVWSVVQPRARTGADPARLQRPLVGRAHEAQVLIDLSGRPFARFDGSFDTAAVGDLPTQMVPHIFRSLADSLGAAIHVRVAGDNDHHKVEACFKAFGRALRQGLAIGGGDAVLPSTKGML